MSKIMYLVSHSHTDLSGVRIKIVQLYRLLTILNFIMKKITKFLIVLAILAVANQSFSQVSFGLRIGTNLSKQKFDYPGATSDDFKDMKMLPGGNLGFLLNITVSEPFSIETGLLFNTKGYRVKYSRNDTTYKEYNYLGYLDLPINAKYTFDLGGPKFYLTAGPYFAFGIFGKQGYKETIGNKDFTGEYDYEWGNDLDKDYKRLDIGLGFGAGFQFGSFVIGANYGLGLKNISPQAEYDMVIKNRFLSISIGTNFGN